MLRVLRLISALAAARVGRVGVRARRRAIQLGLLAAAVGLAAAFGLGALTAGLAARLGLVNALLVMTLISVLAAVILALVIQSDTSRARRICAREAERDRRLYRAAMISGLPGALGRGRLIGVAALAGVALLLLRPRDGEDLDENR